MSRSRWYVERGHNAALVEWRTLRDDVRTGFRRCRIRGPRRYRRARPVETLLATPPIHLGWWSPEAQVSGPHRHDMLVNYRVTVAYNITWSIVSKSKRKQKCGAE